MYSKEHLLVIDELKVSFKTRLGLLRAVDGVSLYMDKGETVGLVGESGCGKTMTAHSLTHLTPSSALIQAKRVTLKHFDILRLNERQLRQIRGKEIAYVFQDPMTYLDPVMKICDQIAEPMIAHGRKGDGQIRDRVLKLLNDVQIADEEKVMHFYPHQLSGGMRQRILLAIALSCQPSLLIADEPTTALDVTIQAAILELLKKINVQYGLSTLLITHDLGIVGETCDRVYIMYAGKIMESGEVTQIYDSPLHPYTFGLLRCVKSVVDYHGSLFSIQGSVPNPLDPPSGCRFQPRCQVASPICSKKEPPVFQVEEGRTVACWQYEEK